MLSVFAVAAFIASGHRDRPVDCVRDRRTPETRGRRGVSLLSHLGNNLWPNCTVPYIVLRPENCGNYTADYGSACSYAFPPSVSVEGPLLEATNEIQTKTGDRCRFVEHDPGMHASTEPLYVIHDPESCYVQNVGYVTGTLNIVNLGWCSTYATVDSIKHELLHILGLEHEHQSPVSSQYMTRCEPQACWSTYNCLQLPDAAWQSYNNTLDFRSIMMYPLHSSCDLGLNPDGTAPLAEQNVDISQVGRLMNISDIDVASILKHYDEPKTGPCSSGGIVDCSGDGDCCPPRWLRDGYRDCEEQTYGCDLSCYDDDGGDCATDTTTTQAPPVAQPTAPPTHRATSDEGSSGLEGWEIAAIAVGCAVAGGLIITLFCGTAPKASKQSFADTGAYTRLDTLVY